MRKVFIKHFYYKKTVSLFVAVQMLLSTAFASTNTYQAANDNSKEHSQYKMQVHQQEQKVNFVNADTNEQLPVEMDMASPEVLKKFSPEQLDKLIRAELLKNAAKNTWSESVRSMPVESFVFFMAMGGIATYKLMTQASSDPTGLQHHLESQLSPIGSLSFFAFMYSQGLTSNMLSLYIKNPHFMHLIPYLGMSVGFFVQTYMSQLLSDPSVQSCAASLIRSKNSDQKTEEELEKHEIEACSQAYDYLLVHKKIWEFAPNLISMLASSYIAGKAESFLVKSATLAGNKLKNIPVKITGVDIAAMLIPGGVEVKGISLVLKGLQITLFMSIDNMINSYINYGWRNIVTANDFYYTNDEMTKGLLIEKTQKWNSNDNTLLASLKYFKKSVSEWRAATLADVYEAHQNWSQMLSSFTAKHNATYGYYSSFVDEALGLQKNGDKSILNMQLPLNGVTPLNLANGKEDLYLTKPIIIEKLQKMNVAKVASNFDNTLAAAGIVNDTDMKSNLLLREAANLLKIKNLLLDVEIKNNAVAISNINSSLQELYVTNSFSQAYMDILRSLRTQLGNPEPLLETGRAFGVVYEKIPVNKKVIDATKYNKVNGLFQIDKFSDYMTVQMVCGPDYKNKESVVKEVFGSGVDFVPPKIDNNKLGSDICYGNGELDASMIYTRPLKVENDTIYTGVVDYLKTNLNSDIIGTQENPNFEKWWDSNTEQQMQNAFKKFENQYKNIVYKLISGLKDTTKSSVLNAGPIYNNPLQSILQESRVYQMILGEIIRDAANAQNKQLVQKTLLDNSNLEPKIVYTPAQLQFANAHGSIPLFSMLGQTKTLEFNHLVQPFKSTLGILFANKNKSTRYVRYDSNGVMAEALSQLDFSTTKHSLKLQNSFEESLLDLIKSFYNFSATKKTATTWGMIKDFLGYDSEQIEINTVDLKTLKEKTDKLSAVLDQYKQTLGLEAKTDQTTNVSQNEIKVTLRLTDKQQKIANTCLENLQSLVDELSNYATVATLVSSQTNQNANSATSAFEQKVQGIVNTLNSRKTVK